MKKVKYLITWILGVLTLASCSNVFSNNVQSEEVGDEKPAIMKEIKFDGTYIQTNDATWPIAFESYIIENGFLVINGNFCIPDEVEITDINKLETKFNKSEENLPYVISYSESSNSVNDVVYSNLENTKWNLKTIDNDLCYFSVNMDISPLVENNKLLGELVIYSYFSVIYRFNGESI